MPRSMSCGWFGANPSTLPDIRANPGMDPSPTLVALIAGHRSLAGV